jgi:hypothetical protein
MSECKHLGWSHTVDGGNEWCAWCEIERLTAEVERVREQRNALRIRLQGYAGEVSRAIYPAISTIEKDIARRALDGEE